MIPNKNIGGKINLIIGNINNEQLVNYFGSNKNIETYNRIKKISTGTKKSLLNKAKLKCDIEDLGGGVYNIKEIYKKEIPKSLFILQEDEVYSTIAPIIIDKLIESKNNNENVLNISLISYYGLMRILNKENYNNIRYNKSEVSKNFDLDLKNMEHFYKIANEKLRYYLEECLDLLKKSNMIFWQKVRAVKVRNVELFNTYEKVKTSITSEYRRATQEEIRFIEDCKTEVCAEFGIGNRNLIPFNFYANKKYHELLIKENIIYDYSLYEVYYTDINNSIDFMSLFRNFKIMDYSKKFSNFIISNIKNSYEDRNKNTDLIKMELDYLFLSNKTLKYESEVLDINTMKVQTYGEYNNHTIESYEL